MFFEAGAADEGLGVLEPAAFLEIKPKAPDCLAKIIFSCLSYWVKINTFVSGHSLLMSSAASLFHRLVLTRFLGILTQYLCIVYTLRIMILIEQQ